MLYRFNDFELDADRFELRRRGVVLSIEPQVLTLLHFLIERREQLVTKDAIIEAVWHGRIVSDSSIASRIRLARNAVDDDGAAQHTIRTVHGRGYRFMAEVERVSEREDWSHILADLTAVAGEGKQPRPDDAAHSSHAKPSIVVLPFQLIGGPHPNSIVADALPHELIQALSRLRWLFVIARGTAFRFRDPDPDIQQIGRSLGVNYCLTGTVEIAAGSMVFSIELSDANDGGVVWSDRMPVSFDAVHEVRTEIVAQVVSAIETYIPLHEARTASLGVSENLDAWSYYHLGLQHMYRFTRQDNEKATVLFEAAVAKDPAFARAFAGLSFTHFQDAFVRYSDQPEKAALNARRFAERSLELDPLDPFANLNMGRYFWLEGQHESSFEWLDRGLTLSPNYAQCIYSRAFTDMLVGNSNGARDYVNNAMRLSPLDPLLYGMRGVRALAFAIDGDYESAALWGERAARAPGAHYLIYMIAVIGHILGGERQAAVEWSREARRLKPDANADQFFKSFPFSDEQTKKRIRNALLLGGFDSSSTY